MNNYAESKKRIDQIARDYGGAFYAAVFHLIDVGIRHLDEETVSKTCEQIKQEDDTNHIMTNDFKCDIIMAAHELSKIQPAYLLVYVQREMTYDVFDGALSYQRAIRLLKCCMDWIESEHCGCAETLDTFEYLGFDGDELEALGFGYMLDVKEEEDDDQRI